MKGLLAITALTSAISCGSAIAHDEAPRRNRNAALELTMTLMPTSAKTSTAVTAIIELPKELSGNDTRNTHGVDTANRVLAARQVAGMALDALTLNPDAEPIPQALLDKHFLRKHGPGACYGQRRR